MYAIRSYYVISIALDLFEKLDVKNLELNINSIGCDVCRPKYNRITSYNVCYTKLLRSAGMVVITGVFLYFSPFDYSMYTILTATTGVIVLLNYIIWRYLSIEKFSDGLFYSIDTLLG